MFCTKIPLSLVLVDTVITVINVIDCMSLFSVVLCPTFNKVTVKTVAVTSRVIAIFIQIRHFPYSGNNSRPGSLSQI